MKIYVLIQNNPFTQNSASANRWLTLIEGISSLDAKIHLLIFGGFINSLEKEISLINLLNLS